jgi:hypothetical protein
VVTNGSPDVPICKLFVSPVTATVWGAERLSGEVLGPGDGVDLSLSPMEYDVDAYDCDGRNVIRQEQYVIGSTPELTLQPAVDDAE